MSISYRLNVKSGRMDEYDTEADRATRFSIRFECLQACGFISKVKVTHLSLSEEFPQPLCPICSGDLNAIILSVKAKINKDRFKRELQEGYTIETYKKQRRDK